MKRVEDFSPSLLARAASQRLLLVVALLALLWSAIAWAVALP